MPVEIDLLSVDRGSVTAPAGCGKTQLIADNLAQHRDPKPVLVLTHTNAGAAALRSRLQRARVPTSAYRVATIDGFAMRLISTFPTRSGHDPQILQISNPRNDYPAIREAARRLLQSRDVSEPLRATYSRLLIDEYQDCSVIQHSIIDALSAELPTVVLGDPMQAIFGFAGNQLVHWQNHVEAQFPTIGALATPWRWRNAGSEELGRWLLDARDLLQRGQSVDVRTGPPEVAWVQLNPATADQQRRAAAQTRIVGNEQTVLIIGDSRNVSGRHQLSCQTPGATSVEKVDLDDLVSFSQRFDIAAPDSVQQIIHFAGSLLTQVGATALIARVETIRSGRARTPPTPAEVAAVAFSTDPCAGTALLLLHELEEQSGARAYRPELLRCLKSALRMTSAGGTSLRDAVVRVRERNRYLGRPVSRRAVGSTLLLKGLEADVAVITHADGMDATNMYVALTRGARRLIVCSTSPLLAPP